MKRIEICDFSFLGVAGAVIWVLGALLVNRSRLKAMIIWPCRRDNTGRKTKKTDRSIDWSVFFVLGQGRHEHLQAFEQVVGLGGLGDTGLAP